MPLAFPPVLLLAILLSLLGTQVAYLMAPRAPRYLVRLALSGSAVLVGEALGRLGIAERLAIGQLHPVTDLLALVILQWAAARWWRRQPV